MSPDLRIASVYYTVLGDESQKKITAKFFEKSKAYIKVELRPFITSRWIPELRFFYDETMEQAYRIEQLLGKIKSDSGSSEG
jgi:ribosome-binding factor A